MHPPYTGCPSSWIALNFLPEVFLNLLRPPRRPCEDLAASSEAPRGLTRPHMTAAGAALALVGSQDHSM